MHGKSKILYMRLYKPFQSTQKKVYDLIMGGNSDKKKNTFQTQPNLSQSLSAVSNSPRKFLTSLTNNWDLRIFFNRLLFFLKIQSFLYQHLFLFVYKSYPRSRLLSSKRNQQPNSFQFSQGSELFSLESKNIYLYASFI